MRTHNTGNQAAHETTNPMIPMIPMVISFDDMLTDFQALYGGTTLPASLDEFIADFEALYAGMDLPFTLDEFLADLRALYGAATLPASLDEFLADFHALYIGTDTDDIASLEAASDADHAAPVMSHIMLNDVVFGVSQREHSSARRDSLSTADMVADIRALYGGAQVQIRVDDLIADICALYPEAAMPVRKDDLVADLRGLYGDGNMLIAVDDLAADIRALYGRGDVVVPVRTTSFVPDSVVHIEDFHTHFTTLHMVEHIQKV